MDSTIEREEWEREVRGVVGRVLDERRDADDDYIRAVAETAVGNRRAGGLPIDYDEATRMAYETAAVHWREQYEHRQREYEELRAAFEMRMRELAEAHATIRTLLKMRADHQL